ncbi:DNA mismatch repair endonuclease MutL [bacterium]|nr:DNA mismatch repair endonuclease MutL [bacterium]
MRRIKQLSKHLINQIAAGEVIERPMSVVKELTENSIDAGATKIEISVSNECRDIRIADNGSGIHPDDIELAFTNHATSKLEDENSLFNIETLGFRGEALASIISISKVVCTTRTKDFEYGIRVEAKGSEITKSQTGCAQGTIFEISDIFYNQPARLKFLKSAKTEFAYIQELVSTIALSHPEISFVLKNNGQLILSCAQNSDLATRINEVYSVNVDDEFEPLKKSDKLSGLEVSGYTSLPTFTRSSKKSYFTFVNSRMVKCPILIKAIDLAYKNTLPIGKYPFVVLNLTLPSEDVDVNAHPTKREIRYKNPNQIFNFVQSAISQAISGLSYKQNITMPAPKSEFAFPSMSEDNDTYFLDETKNIEPLSRPFSPVSVKEQPVLTMKESKQMVQTALLDFPKEEKEEEKIKVIGQYADTYILVENPSGLEIIDQHIAEERYIYEKLKKEQIVASQLILISEALTVEPSESVLIQNSQEVLEKYGYKIDVLEPTKVIFRKIPQILSNRNLQDILTEILQNLKDAQSDGINTLEEKILITTSCKAAVKANTPLTVVQMEDIVRRWRTTSQPYTCPHGRTISHIILHKELAAFFGRQK